MSSFLSIFAGAAILYPQRPQPREPMSYESIEDYNFWKLYIYDHFDQ